MGKVGEIYVKIGSKLDDFDKGMGDVEKAMVKVGKKMEKVGKNLTMKLTLPIVALGAASVKAFSDFDKAMTESTAIMGKLSQETKTKMADVAKTISTETTYSAKELGEAYYFLASAGFDASQSISALDDVARFAQAGAFDLKTATDLLTDAQSALGRTSKDAATNEKLLAGVGDVLVKANTLANASVQQFSEALTNRAGPAMRNYGVELEDGVATLAAFADQGRKGSEAGEAYSIVLRDLQRATQNNREEFERAGIAVYDANGNINEMADIIGDLENHLGTMSPEMKKAALTTLGFQERSQANILTLVGTSEKIREYQKELKKAGGITKEVSDNQLQSFSAQMKLLKNKVVDLGITLGQSLAPIIKSLASFVGKLADKLKNMSPVTRMIITIMAGLTAALGPLLIVIGKVSQGVAVLRTALHKLPTSITALAGPIGIIVVALTTLSLGVLEVINHFKRLKEVGRELDAVDKAAGRMFSTREFLTRLKEVDYKGFLAFTDQWKKNQWDINKTYDDMINSQKKWAQEGKHLYKGMQKAGEAFHKSEQDLEAGLAEIERRHLERLKEEKELYDATTIAEEHNLKTKQQVIQAINTLETQLQSAIDSGDFFISDLRTMAKTLVELKQKALIPVSDTLLKLAGLFKTVREEIVDTEVPVKRFIATIEEEIIYTDVPESRFIPLIEGIGESSEETAEKVEDSWSKTASYFYEAMSKAISEVLDLFKDLGEGAKITFDQISEMVSDMAGSIISAVSDVPAVGEIASFALDILISGWADYFEKKTLEASELYQKAQEKLKELESKTIAEAYEAAPIRTETIDLFWENLSKKFKAGIKSTEEIDDAFRVLLADAKRLGTEGSKGMVDFIKAVRESGEEIASVTAYVKEQLDRIPDALSNLGMRAEDAGDLAVHAFNAMLASGYSFNEAVKAMSPALSDLKKKFEAQGLTANAALAQLFRIADVTEEHKELFDAIDANREIMEALGNSGWMTQEALTTLAGDAYNMYHNLQDAGLTSEEALRAIAPNLQDIVNYAKAYNIELDDSVQKLIEEAQSMGLVTEAQETEAEKQEKANERLIGAIEKGFKGLADTIQEAFSKAFGIVFDDMLEKSRDAIGEFEKMWDKSLGNIGGAVGSVGGGFGGSGGGGGGAVLPAQTGMAFVPSGPTPMMVHADELVDITPLAELQTTGHSRAGLSMGGDGGEAYNFSFTIHTTDTLSLEQWCNNQFLPVLKQTIHDNRGGITREIADETRKFPS